jgi:hypothetical protein
MSLSIAATFSRNTSETEPTGRAGVMLARYPAIWNEISQVIADEL